MKKKSNKFDEVIVWNLKNKARLYDYGLHSLTPSLVNRGSPVVCRLGPGTVVEIGKPI